MTWNSSPRAGDAGRGDHDLRHRTDGVVRHGTHGAPAEPAGTAHRRVAAGRAGQRIEVDPRGGSELHTIADALNDYLDRNEQFVERERVFISTASHELRTPIAVMTGAAELALEQPGLPERARQQMQRVLRTAQSVEQLIELLLVLARDPARLAARAERIALDQLLPEIVDDHRHLRRQGPEHRYPGRAGGYRRADGGGAGGDRQPAAQCHREQRSRPYRTAAESVGGADPAGPRARHEPGDRGDPRMARGGRADRGSGIGLDLIARLCEHLGWTLQRAARDTRHPGLGFAPGLIKRPTCSALRA